MKYLKYLYPAGLVFLGVAIGYALLGFFIPNTWYYASVYQEIPIVETKILPVYVEKQIPVLQVKTEKVIMEVPVVSTKIQIVEKVVEVPVYKEIIREVPVTEHCLPYGQWKKHEK